MENDKPTRLVWAAGSVVHERGFNATSLAQIAERADVPLGNMYYYFKTKDALGHALVEQYGRHQEALRQVWESNDDPHARLEAFINSTVSERDVLARHGCPIGTLNAELHKQGGPLAQRFGDIFADSLAWLAQQFRDLGRGVQESRRFAAHLLSALQGAALLAHTFDDPDFVTGEAALLKNWIQAL